MPVANRREPEHTFCTEIPKTPVHLKKAGATEFVRICGYFLDNGTLAFIFLPAIERLCVMIDRMEYLDKRYNELQEKHMLTPGAKKSHPIVRIMQAQEDKIMRAFESLGMTPKSRKNGNIPLSGNGPSVKKKPKERPNLDKGIFDTVPFPKAAGG